MYLKYDFIICIYSYIKNSLTSKQLKRKVNDKFNTGPEQMATDQINPYLVAAERR